METIYSAAGVIAILFFLFAFAIPSIFSKSIRYIEEQVHHVSLLLFWTFFVSYFFMGVWMIVAQSSKAGLLIIFFMTLAFGYLLYKKISISDLLINIVFHYKKYFYWFNMLVLLLAIFVFYKFSVEIGAIMAYSVIIYFLFTTGSLYFIQKRDKEKLESLQEDAAKLDAHTLGDMIDFFKAETDDRFYWLEQTVGLILASCVELIYVNYVPKDLYTLDKDKLNELLEKYILSEESITNQEKKIIRELMLQREKLIKWKEEFEEKIVAMADTVKTVPPEKNDSSEKKNNVKTKKRLTKENKPPKSAG